MAWPVAASLGVQFTGVSEDSAFYGGTRGTPSPRLTAADRRVLAWYYTHVPPGTKEVGPLDDKHDPKGE